MMTNSNQLAKLTSRIYFRSEQDFVNQLHDDIHTIIELMEGSSDKYYCDDEDKLTHAIVSSLHHYGYVASEQTKKNGTVDITVKAKENDYTWIAEAKIGYGNTKIFEGMLQLLTRYVKRDENSGLIIYYQKKNSNTCFNNWLKYLYNKEWEAYCSKKDILDDITPLLGHLNQSQYSPTTTYYSDMPVYKPCGKPLNLRIFYADLHHNPRDKSGVTNQSLILGQAKNTLRDYCQQWDDGTFHPDSLPDLIAKLKINVDFE